MIDLYIKIGDMLPFVPHAPFHLRAYQHWQGYNTAKAKKEISLKTRFLEETVRDSISWFARQRLI